MSLLLSCNKFLDLKPSENTRHIDTFQDVEYLLNYQAVTLNNHNTLLEVGSDDFIIDPTIYLSRAEVYQKLYIWDLDAYLANNILLQTWTENYSTILYANLALESLDGIKDADEGLKSSLIGEALFLRSSRFYQLLQIYSPPYHFNDADHPFGIPIRLNTNVEIGTNRSSIKASYKQVIDDLLLAIERLPEKTNNLVTPTKSAARALLARIYLIIGDDENALLQANNFLEYSNELMDFNSMDIQKNFPFPIDNKEVVYFGIGINFSDLLSPNVAEISESLLNLYHKNDLRKTAFFVDRGNGRFRFKGNYAERGITMYAGYSNNEIYLIKSEALIRLGEINEGMKTLNHLLVNRYDRKTFKPWHATDNFEALKIVLEERRKELPFRGIRWTDLRRLNRDPRFAITLERKFIGKDGQVLRAILPPNDLTYTYLIPNKVIDFNPKIIQNKR